jgi:monoamine oxidase
MVGDYEAGDASTLDSGAYTEMCLRTAHNGENQLLKYGYHQLIEYLSKDLPIETETIVREIDYSNNNVVITLEDGKILRAKKVIVTVSLGVLKSKSIKFMPELPQSKQSVISDLGMGNAVKLMLRFRDPHDVNSLFHIADGDNETLQTITCWWASASDPRVLVGYCGGSRSSNVLNLPEKRLLEKVTADLEVIVGQKLNNEIVDYKIARWDNNPFTLGAYSNHPVGTRNDDRKILASSIVDSIYFAGEATVDNGNYATVHGAIESGYRVASEILANK